MREETVTVKMSYDVEAQPNIPNAEQLAAGSNSEALPPPMQRHFDDSPDHRVILYKKDDIVIGGFCKICKEEWYGQSFDTVIVKDFNMEEFPRYCCLTVGDTGELVEWADIGKLQKGDHVAWMRKCRGGYWHHAIVDEINDETIKVYEWTKSKLQTEIQYGDVSPLCMCDRVCNRMYRVTYPTRVSQENETELIVLRAKARLHEQGYSLPSDNCEHFATFCKTGRPYSHQICQLKLSAVNWLTRILFLIMRGVMYFILLTYIIDIDRPTNVSDDGFFRFLVMAGSAVLVESIYLLIAGCAIWRVDKSPSNGICGHPSHPRWNAFWKLLLKSLSIMISSIVASLVFSNLICKNKTQRDLCNGGYDAIFGLAGALVGVLVGYILVYYPRYEKCWMCKLKKKILFCPKNCTQFVEHPCIKYPFFFAWFIFILSQIIVFPVIGLLLMCLTFFTCCYCYTRCCREAIHMALCNSQDDNY